MAAALATVACASAPPRSAVAPGVFLPPPPDERILELVAIQPDPAARPRRSFWRATLELITGAEQRPEDRSLARPFGVAFAADGTLVVADPDAARVVRIDARGSPDDLTCPGSRWVAPMAVARDGVALLVVDAGDGAVVRWTDGGCEKLGVGVLDRPTGLAVAADRIWVVDAALHELLALARTGAVLARVGAPGAGDEMLHSPTAVATGPTGEVLVVDSLNFRVVRLSAEGRWIGSFGRPGEDGDGLARPKGIAVGGDGRIYVSDAQRDAVLVFAPDGAFVAALGSTGGEPGRFAHPAGLALADGKLAVADSQNRRIQVFQLLRGLP